MRRRAIPRRDARARRSHDGRRRASEGARRPADRRSSSPAAHAGADALRRAPVLVGTGDGADRTADACSRPGKSADGRRRLVARSRRRRGGGGMSDSRNSGRGPGETVAAHAATTSVVTAPGHEAGRVACIVATSARGRARVATPTRTCSCRSDRACAARLRRRRTRHRARRTAPCAGRAPTTPSSQLAAGRPADRDRPAGARHAPARLASAALDASRPRTPPSTNPSSSPSASRPGATGFANAVLRTISRDTAR